MLELTVFLACVQSVIRMANAAIAAEKPYRVNLWGSKPGSNDDCHTGEDFATLAEADAAYWHPEDHFTPWHYFCDIDYDLWIEIEGTDGYHAARQIHAARTSKVGRDNAWRREIAMEAGMGMGIDAYNDTMGY